MSENTTTSENGSREFLPPSMPTQKQPICRLSILAAILFVLVPIIYVAAILIPLSVSKGNYDVSEILTNVFLVILGCLLVLSLAISIVALVRIALSDRRLGGDVLTGITLAGGSGILFFASMPAAFMIHMKPFICATNLEGLVTALKVYVEDHDDQLPPADQWCDVLIVDYDVSPKSFICPASDALEGESCYALNKFVVGKKLSELPAGTVLLFETCQGADGERDMPCKDRGFVQKMPDLAADHMVYKNRWNQVGGPEIMYGYHFAGITVAFSDSFPEYLSIRHRDEIDWTKLEELVWNENQTRFKAADYITVSHVFQKQNSRFYVIILGGLVLAGGICIIHWTGALRYGWFCLFVALCAAAIGLGFGTWAQEFYQSEFFKGAGAVAGAVAGAWLSLCFVGAFLKYAKSLVHRRSIIQLGVGFGIITGAICTILLHLALITIYHEPMGLGLMALGLPFGIAAGAILGLLSGWIVCRFYLVKKEQAVETV
jgi:hypothetical protein